MAKAPVMPVFTDALIGDTTHLSTEQFGAYVLILIATWRNNGRALPDDDQSMAHICRVGTKKWRFSVRPKLARFFTISDTGWHQLRLEKEWIRVERVLKQKANAGRSGGKANAIATASLAMNHEPGSHRELEESESLSESPVSPARVREEGEENLDQDTLEHASRAFAAPEARADRGMPVRIGELTVRRRTKTPALKAEIKAMLAWKHCRFLQARGSPGEAEAYFAAIDAKTMLPPAELFEAVDARMRAAGWDDTREPEERGMAA